MGLSSRWRGSIWGVCKRGGLTPLLRCGLKLVPYLYRRRVEPLDIVSQVLVMIVQAGTWISAGWVATVEVSFSAVESKQGLSLAEPNE